MPLFYFHLGLGNRILRDDEGTELDSRAAARAEAQAIVRELVPTAASCSSLYPSNWFLRVADADGQFLHLPIDRPALEVVTAEPPPEPPPTPAAADVSAPGPTSRAAQILARFLDRRRDTTALLRRNHQLRQELTSELQACHQIRRQTADLIAYARTVNFAWGGGLAAWRGVLKKLAPAERQSRSTRG
jgi:hypothetical protein